MTILDQLAGYARERVEKEKNIVPLADIRKQAYDMEPGTFAFEAALKKPGLSFICECKKASPSKGLIAPEFPYLDIAKEYEEAGADAISVLTEPKWFLGQDAYLADIAGAVTVPLLRKDFTVDEYMLYQAKVLGASAVLLIVAILSEKEIRQSIQICDELGLSALVEIHDETEADIALSAGARIVGVNNRNLKDFTVDPKVSFRLRDRIPDGVSVVSESGIQNAEDVRAIKHMGVDAVLIGEALMRAADKKELLGQFRGVG